MENAFCKMCVTVCGSFYLEESTVAGYGNRIQVKYTAKWGVQIEGMIFLTRSRKNSFLLFLWERQGAVFSTGKIRDEFLHWDAFSLFIEISHFLRLKKKSVNVILEGAEHLLVSG